MIKHKFFVLPLVFLLFHAFNLFPVLNAQQPGSLPEDFPEIIVNVHDDPEPGYIFITPCGIWGHFPGAAPYLAILDNYGIPVFYQKLNQPAFDFKLQPSGMLSYNDGSGSQSIILMDSSYTIADKVSVVGYGTDFHEFRILENGNYLMLGFDDRVVDMDTVVAGGHPGVTVRGALIQETTSDGTVLWEWTSWDHYKITNAMYFVDLTVPDFIDYVHANAIDQDTDSTILISSRNMYEITKLSKNTGEIIWRLGGENNQFTYNGDPVYFSAQHHIRKIDNGNYILFDNGWEREPQRSCVVEFMLDEINKTATLVKEHRSQPDDIYGEIMGSNQRLPGGNTFVGWGSGVPNVTEFNPDGTKALEFEFESVSYRAFKFPWKTNAFTTDSDTIEFGEINSSDSSIAKIVVNNNLDSTLTITSVENHTENFLLFTTLPVQIPAHENDTLYLLFKPGGEGEFSDLLTICNDIETEALTRRIARQVWVKGLASEEFAVDQIDGEMFSLYPNPTKGRLNIEFRSPTAAQISILDLQGKILQSGNFSNKAKIKIDISKYPPGTYLLKMILPKEGKQSTLKILKH
jgi:hypothetical protein